VYRELRLARYFRDPAAPNESVLKVGSIGVACSNVRIALNYLGFDIAPSDVYDLVVFERMKQLQSREGHTHVDGYTGPGTRDLLVRTLLREGGERPFQLMKFPKGEAFPVVFVSYAREDRPATEVIVDRLVSEGVQVWVDYRNLRPGERWELVIERAIPASRYFLALISKFALSKTGYFQKEVKTAWAVAERYPDSEVFVIPARLEECEVHDAKFAQLHRIDFFPDASIGLEQLLQFLAQAD
jgi:TIR domain